MLEQLRAENARLRRRLREAGADAEEAQSCELESSPASAEGPDEAASATGGQRASATAAATHLAREEALHRAIVESATDFAIISMDRAGLVTSWNEGASRIMGWTEEEMLGRSAHLFFTEDEIAQGIPEQEMQQARDLGRGEDERFHRRKDGSVFWANGLMMPMRDENDGLIGYVKILRDRTAQHAAIEALQRSEVQLRLERNTLEAIFEAAPVGLSLAEAPAGAAILLNTEVQRIVGGGVDLKGDDVERYRRGNAVHADGAPYEVEDYPTVRALRHGEVVRNEPIIFQRPDASRQRAEISSSPIRDFEGRIVAAITTVVDVEAREQAIEHQQLLMNELAHRMKNTLSITQAIVSQTLRASTSLDAARTEIMERLAALSRAQDALTRKSWVAASLEDTVEAALAPLGLGPERLLVEGPEITVGSRAALSFTLALHELATNAVKYGALSAPEGRVEVRWREPEPGRLEFTWNEKDGPAVGPPSRRGFGSRLIETVSRTFAGASTLTYDPAGVCWRATAGLEALQAF